MSFSRFENHEIVGIAAAVLTLILAVCIFIMFDHYFLRVGEIAFVVIVSLPVLAWLLATGRLAFDPKSGLLGNPISGKDDAVIWGIKAGRFDQEDEKIVDDPSKTEDPSVRALAGFRDFKIDTHKYMRIHVQHSLETFNLKDFTKRLLEYDRAEDLKYVVVLDEKNEFLFTVSMDGIRCNRIDEIDFEKYEAKIKSKRYNELNGRLFNNLIINFNKRRVDALEKMLKNSSDVISVIHEDNKYGGFYIRDIMSDIMLLLLIKKFK